MPRLSSFRSLWTAARSGLLVSLLICVGGLGLPVYGDDPGAMGSGMYGDPLDTMGSQQQTNALVNRPSGIKRSGNSLGSLQSLLYSDTAQVFRFCFNKIDYEGLNSFFNDLVDGAGGSVRSDDSYLVQLREYQKDDIKSSFKQMLQSFQNVVVQKCFSKKVDEAYLIFYAKDGVLDSFVLALPTDGLNEAEQKQVIDDLDSNNLNLNPITVFVRYGFIVAVLKHSSVVPFDLEKIQDAYRAKMLEKQKGSAYGSYGASNNSAYGSSGMNSGAFGSASPSFSRDSYGRDNMNQANQVVNSLGLPSDLLAEYLEEVKVAQERWGVEARRSALPYVRQRFSKPATAEEAKPFFDALSQVDGVAFSTVSSDLAGDLYSHFMSNKESDDIATPFSGFKPESADKKAESVWLPLVREFLDSDVLKDVKSASLATSLVGSPKIGLIGSFATAEDAQTYADAAQAALIVFKPKFDELLKKEFGDSAKDVDVTSLTSQLFEKMKPQVLGDKVAIVIDLDVLKENAALFIPLLGGTETKSAQQMESESIDWSVAEEKKDDTVDAAAEQADDDDPFAEDDEDDSNVDEDDADEDVTAPADESDDEDDPFGADDEEDPFA